jgi:Zn-dependent protease with chaperone function
LDLMDLVMLQVTQPYFYYSIASMFAAFLAVNIVFRISNFCSHRVRSYIHIIPLMTPLFVFIMFFPKLEILSGMDGNGGARNIVPDQISPFIGAYTSVHSLAPPQLDEMFSYTGLLCIIGLVLATLVFILCLCPSTRSLKRFNVILCSKSDFPEVQDIVRNCAIRSSIAVPTMGILEDLRPNAFVTGHGRNSTIILSLGLITTFTPAEIEAAIAHEMMHLRHRDHLFRSIVLALNAVSFYNPLAYMSTMAALREREHWADTGSIGAGYSLSELENALRKVSGSVGDAWASSFLGMSLWFSVRSPHHSHRWLSFHPSVEQRIDAIRKPGWGRKSGWSYIALSLITIIMISASILVSFQDVRTIVTSDNIGAPDGTLEPIMHEDPLPISNGTVATDLANATYVIPPSPGMPVF